MKIAFVGKGGSGKSTLSALLCRFLAAQGRPVLGIDADINQHLGEALGLDADSAASLPPMGLRMTELKEYLRGENSRITEARAMLKTTPPGRGSSLLRLTEPNPFFETFTRTHDGIRIAAVGPFDESDIGVKCYHSKTGSVELLLNHLLDGEKEYIVTDMTAGADSFASGLFTRFDMTFVVVEPTLKSVGVFKQYCHFAEGYPVRIRAIGNKVDCTEDRAFLETHLGDALIATVPTCASVKRAERGERQTLDTLEPEVAEALRVMQAAVDSTPKDWDTYLKVAIEFHVKNALDWGNESVGEDLRVQVDPTFSYRTALKEQ